MRGAWQWWFEDEALALKAARGKSAISARCGQRRWVEEARDPERVGCLRYHEIFNNIHI